MSAEAYLRVVWTDPVITPREPAVENTERLACEDGTEEAKAPAVAGR